MYKPWLLVTNERKQLSIGNCLSVTLMQKESSPNRANNMLHGEILKNHITQMESRIQEANLEVDFNKISHTRLH